MSPKGAFTVLSRLMSNPYAEVYEKMDEYELRSWKMVFEQSIGLGGASRDKALRLRAINQSLANISSNKVRRAA